MNVTDDQGAGDQGTGGWGKPIKKIAKGGGVPGNTEITTTRTFNTWPNDRPNHPIRYQWKCQIPADNTQKKKLVQAAYAVAMAKKPTADRILIRSANVFHSAHLTNVRISYQVAYPQGHCL
jgi:hypothetical protein